MIIAAEVHNEDWLRGRAWPGHRYDREIAALYARQFETELPQAIDADDVASGWLSSQSILTPDNTPGLTTKAAIPPLMQSALAWLEAQGWAQKLYDAISRILNNLWAEGFAVGREAGKEMLTSAYDSDFWDKWHPGDPDAARLAAGPGLQQLLQDYGIRTIKSIVATRMGQLANLLADGFQRGDSSQTIADSIRSILSAPQRAEMIAHTELARATVAASMAEYVAMGVRGKSWMPAADGRVCPVCKLNQDAGAIPLGNAFPGGVPAPPQHPVCRCALTPEDLPNDPIPDLTSVGAAQKRAKVSKESANYRQATGKQRCGNCSMIRPNPPDFESYSCTLVEGLIRPGDTCDEWEPIPAKILRALLTKDDEPLTTDGYVAGGLAVRARDTGRVLMIQRGQRKADGEPDPNAGCWEFPGGRPEGKETVLEAAVREWMEETGLRLPEGKVVSHWDQGDYRGHVLDVPDETSIPLLDRERGADPDDLDGDEPEALAWWDPSELKDNPVMRPELQEHPKRIRRALEATGDPVRKGVLQRMAIALHVDSQTVYDQLARNYPPDSIQWVLRAKWGGPYLVPWEKIDHEDMDKWAASHETGRVDSFAKDIEAGDEVQPVVLAADPDGNYIDVDGHHRALAYRKLGRSVRSWIGVLGSPADRHAMEETHLSQYHAGSSALNKAWEDEPRDARGRWVSEGGLPAPGGPVTFRVRAGSTSSDFDRIIDARNYVSDLARAGIKARIGYAPGHDARHVSQLVERVRNNAMSREDAMDELSHAPKLQDKLRRHLEIGYEPEHSQTAQQPRQDLTPAERLDNLPFLPSNAAKVSKLLKGYSDADLRAMADEASNRFYSTGDRNWSHTSSLISGELVRRAQSARRREQRAARTQQAEESMADWKGLADEFGKNLESDGTAQANSHIAVLDRYMPAAFKAALRNYGTTIVATKESVGNSEPDLANMQPRGHTPGSTWKNVAGGYRPALKRLIMGDTVSHGSVSLPLHEGSHAIDSALRYPSENSPYFALSVAELGDDTSPYYNEHGNPSGYLSEAFAELGAAWMLNKYDPAPERQRKMLNAVGVYTPRSGDWAATDRYHRHLDSAATLDAFFAKLLEDVQSGKDALGYPLSRG